MPITISPIDNGVKMKKSYKSGPRFGPNAWNYKNANASKEAEEIEKQSVASIEPVELVQKTHAIVVEEKIEIKEEIKLETQDIVHTVDENVETISNEKSTEAKNEVKSSPQERRKK